MSDPRLPGVLAEMAEVAGRDTALAIALAYGGEDSWYAPRNLDSPAGRALVTLVGIEAAQSVTRHFGGGAICVPLARRALVVHLHQQGLTTAQIARRLRITRSTTRRYRRCV